MTGTIEYTIHITDTGILKRVTVTEAVHDTDTGRQTQRFCGQTYEAGHTHNGVWYPPHRIHEITWKVEP